MPRRATPVSLLALVASLAVCAAAFVGPSVAVAQASPAGRAEAAASHPTAAAATADRAKRCTLSALLVPKCGRLFGAYVRPVGSQSSEEAFKSLERRTGSRLRVMHFYHGAPQLFPSDWEINFSKHGHRLLLNWKPEGGNSWRAVANGASDSYIDREAEYVRQHYGHKKFWMTIHHEPEEEVRDQPGSGYTASDFAAMFRHVVDRFHAKGVRNVVWVMTYMGAQVHAVKSWYSDLWPGRHYVDWIGFDRYSAPPMGEQTGGFKAMVNRHWGETSWRGAYRWAHQHFPHKPVMLPEWGASEKPGDPGWKSRLFDSVPRDLRAMPNLKLISYFDSAAATGGDKRVDSTARSMNAWQRLAARAIFHR